MSGWINCRTIQFINDQDIINYAYDDLGQLVRTWTGDTVSSVDGGTPTTENVYTYDTLGRLATVTQTWRQATDIADETTSYTYDLNGNLATQVTEWNNVVSDYDYDEMNRLTHLTHFVDSNGDRILDDMSEQTLAMFNYSYLADGTRSQAVETDDLGDVTTITWEYDALNRLVSETSQSTNDDRDYTDQFTYDLSSNRLTQTHTTLSDVVTTVYFYDANDRLLAEVQDSTADDSKDTFTEYAYNNTNQTGKTVFAGTDNTGDTTSSVTYTYDASGRMTMVQTDSDGDGSINSTVTYTYDTSSHRVTETTNDPGSGTTTTRSFLFDPQNATGYGKQIEEHVDGQLSKTFIIGHMIIAQHDATNGLLNFIQGGHGNTRALINTAAVIVQRFAFDAYGKTLTAANYTTADDALTMRLNPDGAYSIATGLTNHIERWRSGARFLSLDSYSGNTVEPISLHKYLYAHANPVIGIDPNGEFSLLQTTVAGAIVGGIVGMTYGAYRGAKQSGKILSWKTLEYSFYGLLAGAASGAAVGAVSFYAGPLMLRLIPQGIRLSLAGNHPSYAVAFGIGVLAGVGVSLSDTDFAKDAMNIISVSGLSFGAGYLGSEHAARVIERVLGENAKNWYATRRLWRNWRGRPVTPRGIPRALGAWGLMFTAGFVVGYSVTELTTGLTDKFISIAEAGLEKDLSQQVKLTEVEAEESLD